MTDIEGDIRRADQRNYVFNKKELKHVNRVLTTLSYWKRLFWEMPRVNQPELIADLCFDDDLIQTAIFLKGGIFQARSV